MTFDKKLYISRMVDNLGQQEVEGLGYGLLHGYITGGTQDKEFDEAVELASENLEIIKDKLDSFAEDVFNGHYNEYLDKDGQIK